MVAPRGGWGRGGRRVPWWESEVGYAYVYDPRFRYRNFLVTGLGIRADRARLGASLWSAPEDTSSRWRIEAAYRPLGPSRIGRVRDGSFLDLQAAVTDHRLPQDGFATTTVEWTLAGRLDLERIDSHLAGSFGELSLGTGYQVLRFEAGGNTSTGTSLLLARQAFGVYVGDQDRGGGEWSFYYDHRHDTLAGGLLGLGVGSGVAGHLGVEGVHYFDRRFGIATCFELGSAVILGVFARIRDWGAP